MADWQIEEFGMMLKNNRYVLIMATLVGGFISSLVKSRTESNMPPRMAGEISPPAANIDAWLGWLGINTNYIN